MYDIFYFIGSGQERSASSFSRYRMAIIMRRSRSTSEKTVRRIYQSYVRLREGKIVFVLRVIYERENYSYYNRGGVSIANLYSAMLTVELTLEDI